MVNPITLIYGFTSEKSNFVAFNVLLIIVTFLAREYNNFINSRRFNAQRGKSARILGLDQSLKACGKCTDTDRFFSQIRSKLFCSSLDNAEHIDKFILAAAEKQFSIADISDFVNMS